MKTYVMEHKTCSEDLGPGSVYWKKLTLDAQISNYLVGARALGHDPQGVLYDVLRKPALRPYEANTKRARDETPEEFLERCIAEIASKPDHYYRRGVVVRLEEEEREAAFDAWHVAAQIRESRNTNTWPRNVDACSQYNRMCDYWEVCSGEASIDDPLRFGAGGSNPELDTKTHLPMLTSSSTRNYRACPRRYYFAHERGVRARNQGNAIHVGRRVHAGLEAWLTSDRNLAAAVAAMATMGPFDHESARAEAMVTGYHARWADEPIEVLAVETEFQADLINPTTGAKSRTWVRAGKIDAIVNV